MIHPVLLPWTNQGVCVLFLILFKPWQTFLKVAGILPAETKS